MTVGSPGEVLKAARVRTRAGLRRTGGRLVAYDASNGARPWRRLLVVSSSGTGTYTQASLEGRHAHVERAPLQARRIPRT
ncbi:hypothetical protein [Spongiactinospora gelatinilytica]|nr:hypothetical protein [Spongiactinospora gelatinilytica]